MPTIISQPQAQNASQTAQQTSDNATEALIPERSEPFTELHDFWEAKTGSAHTGTQTTASSQAPAQESNFEKALKFWKQKETNHG